MSGHTAGLSCRRPGADRADARAPDHCGGAAELRARSGAPVLLHRADWPLTDPARRHGDVFMRASAAWFLRHGLSAGTSEATGAARGELVERNQPFTPDRALREGNTLALGRFTMRVLWCPGHSPGQVCLYDERARVLLAGDHVLLATSPNIGCYTADDSNPLGDYLASLRRVRDLPVDVTFPGHGEPFHELAARVDTRAAHHEAQPDALLALLAPAPLTAFDLCVRLRWSGGPRGWADLAPFHHRLALAERIAHLELLRARPGDARGARGHHSLRARYLSVAAVSQRGYSGLHHVAQPPGTGPLCYTPATVRTRARSAKMTLPGSDN